MITLISKKTARRSPQERQPRPVLRISVPPLVEIFFPACAASGRMEITVKKPWTQRVGDFVTGKGFYIVLFLCVAAIGISGYYLVTTLGGVDTDAAVNGPAQVVVTPAPTPSAAVTPPAVTSAPKPTPAASPAPTPTPAAPTPASTQRPAAAVFTWPVKGEVLREFSLEVLAYDETMRDWRTHSGVDIAASVGTQVLAVSDGTVEKVYQDDLMGTTVVIDHGNGLRSSYFNLAPTPTVEEGDTVSTGSIIGAVGTTAIAESYPAHLHFEMTLNDLAADPARYLPE